jgi:hypothetical protein
MLNHWVVHSSAIFCTLQVGGTKCTVTRSFLPTRLVAQLLWAWQLGWCHPLHTCSDVWIVGWHRLASKMNENDTNSINQLLRSLSSSAKSLLKEFLGSKARPAEVGTSRHFFVRTLEKRVLLIVWRRCWQPPFGHCATTAMGSRAWCFFSFDIYDHDI